MIPNQSNLSFCYTICVLLSLIQSAELGSLQHMTQTEHGSSQPIAVALGWSSIYTKALLSCNPQTKEESVGSMSK